MNRLTILEGMRVLNTDCRKEYQEGTVVRTTRPQANEPTPEYALVRYDSFFRRDEWVHVMNLHPIKDGRSTL
jgi:hypothetical protein